MAERGGAILAWRVETARAGIAASTSSDDGAASTSVGDADADDRRRRGSRALPRPAAWCRSAAGRSYRHWPAHSDHNSACSARKIPCSPRPELPTPPEGFVVASFRTPIQCKDNGARCREPSLKSMSARSECSWGRPQESDAAAKPARAGSAKKRAARVTGRPPAPSRGRGQRVAQPQAKPPLL